MLAKIEKPPETTVSNEIHNKRLLKRYHGLERTDQGGADVARALNLTPSAINKIVLRARNDPALKNGVNDVLNLVDAPRLK